MIPLTRMALAEEDVAAVLDCYRSGWLTLGPRTQAFEAAFAQATGAQEAVAVSSGTAAVHLALLAAGVQAGDEVLLPALTFPGTAAMVRACGATPVRCDIRGPGDLNLDVGDVAARIGPATRAVLATHYWGYPCDVAALREVCDTRGLALIEDAAHAVLASGVGHADLTCYSLSSSKQLAVGEGGVVTGRDSGALTRVRSLRSHAMTSGTWDRHRGQAASYDVVDVGFNYRIDEPRAALALSRLPRLPQEIEHRRTTARRYRAQLAGAPGLSVPFTDDAVAASSHGGFGVLLADRAAREAAAAVLAAAGVQTAPLGLVEPDSGRLPPVAADAAARGLRLPLSSSTSADEVTQVVALLRQPPGRSRS